MNANVTLATLTEFFSPWNELSVIVASVADHIIAVVALVVTIAGTDVNTFVVPISLVCLYAVFLVYVCMLLLPDGYYL